MTMATDLSEAPLPIPPRARKAAGGRPIQWLRANLFSSVPNALITLILAFLLVKAGISFAQWGFSNAIWHVGHHQAGLRCFRGLNPVRWQVGQRRCAFAPFRAST